MSRNTARALTVFAGLLLVGAVVSATAAQPPRRGGVLRIAHIGEPPTLDWHWSSGAIVSHILNNLYEAPVAMDSKFQVHPMLAERVEVSANRLTYTFRLRRGVRFHHGREMTSDDVRASLERWGRVNFRGRIVFANVESVANPDAATVVMKLKEPYALLLQDLGSFQSPAAVYPKEVVDEAGATGPIRRFIGTGPYRLVERIPDRHIRLDRFDEYASRTEPADGNTGRKAAYFDSIVFVPVPDQAVRIAGVRRGEFQFAEQISSDQFDQLRADSTLVPYVATLPFWNAAIFNNRQGLMSQAKIRQAFQAAIDHGPVMRAAFGPQQFWRLDAGIMPKEHPMYTDAGKEFFNQHTPTKARRLLEEAGYRGEPIRWMTTTEFPHQATSAQVVKPMLERVGFVVDLQVMDWATLVGRRGRPDLWDVFSTQIAFFPDPVFVVPLQHTWPGWWSHRDGMAMMELLRRHTNPATRKQIWQRLQRTWYADAGSIKFGDYFEMHLHRRELRGFVENPTHTWYNAWLER
ncbi:MAG: ABC transporter substrate-binding protein [Armatimonadota bacterium]|nr:ABC transporter substrate-binding protein [Armatimonadota bacterium]